MRQKVAFINSISLISFCCAKQQNLNQDFSSVLLSASHWSIYCRILRSKLGHRDPDNLFQIQLKNNNNIENDLGLTKTMFEH